ncbi:uncharacterized protein LOC127871333 isoform X3 [Dreissena polymorpha]|uniref:Uncharacterized protein n=1 Tax=Dreissena polymorpha TaxID=45954 RepID=A0A9D4R6U1_DREPO|nr:uncharacterized protein LOC127871333 isoform X1 [Dreissena polymorpha]XP_052270104.1 uncharacterized protein LOC127871333 isoform X3 [Dreissena polymorpha]KAH3857144.1 hypothetical protein DPMN_099744 [Dreissena polymorpha]
MDDSGTSSRCDTGISSTSDTGCSSTCDAGFSSTCDTGFSNNCDSGKMGGFNDTAFSYDNFTENTYANANLQDSFMHATFPATYGYMDTYSVSSGLPPPFLVQHHSVRRPGDSSVYIGRPMVIPTPTQQHKMMQRDSKRRKCIGCLVLLLVLAGVITAITLTLKYAKKL